MDPREVPYLRAAWSLLLFASAVLATESAAWSAAVCKREKMDMPVNIVGTSPVLNARFNGEDVRLMLDSGAFWGMISGATAAQYKLKLKSAPFGLEIRGVGGSTIPQLATVKEFSVGHRHFAGVDFLVGGGEVQRDSAGLLGQNFLEKWNVEYDLSQAMVRLFRDVDCANTMLAYWVKPDQAISMMDIARIDPLHPLTIGTAYINGVKIRVLFDTGAQRSLLSLRAARRAGVKLDTPGVVPAGSGSGIGRNLVATYLAPFDSFKIGDGEEIKHTRLLIADDDFGEADMLLGSDFFISHRIFVANSQRRLYLTYNGGPVFNLAATLRAAAPLPVPLPVPMPAADAAELVRHATALAGRREFDAALADFSRAIELDATNADYVYERGLVYRQKADSKGAMTDFDRAIELRPDHVLAMRARADLFIEAGDIVAARVDLDGVDGAAAQQADVRLELARDYLKIAQPSKAVAQLDLWIPVHRDDARLPAALSSRCWARALANQALPDALKDCNAALHRFSKTDAASSLAARGLVFLRLGDDDKAIVDYDEALKSDPKNAWALYGRSIARTKRNKPDAAADRAGAIALEPGIEDQFRRYGIIPPVTD